MAKRLSSVLMSMDDVLAHWCPGCRTYHRIWVNKLDNKPVWDWNGNVEDPTFSPSIKISTFIPSISGNNFSPMIEYVRCHYSISNGIIIYYPDCEHELSGRSILLPDIPECFFN